MSLQKPTKTSIGKKGEDLASKFLIQKGYKIIKRNFHSIYGEIDIIATHENSLVFIEVKTRSNTRFGLPIEAVTPRKIENIQKTAEYFCLQNPNMPKSQKIEVVSVDTSQDKPNIILTSVF